MSDAVPITTSQKIATALTAFPGALQTLTGRATTSTELIVHKLLRDISTVLALLFTRIGEVNVALEQLSQREREMEKNYAAQAEEIAGLTKSIRDMAERVERAEAAPGRGLERPTFATTGDPVYVPDTPQVGDFPAGLNVADAPSGPAVVFAQTRTAA